MLVIMSNHNVKVAGAFQNLIRQCLMTDCSVFVLRYFVCLFFTLGEQGNCGTIFFEKRLHGFLHGGQSNNNIIIDLAKPNSGAPHY